MDKMDEKNSYMENYWVNNDPDYLNSKKKVLKLLRILGIDTRYISYFPNRIYVNDIRFSKFSKKREETFKKYFPEIAIVRSTIFQKICSRASKIFADKLHPKDNILLLKPQNRIDNLLEIVLEPYSRKYAISIFESNFLSIDEAISVLNKDISEKEKKDIYVIASSLTLNEEVESILSNVFSGNIIDNDKIDNEDIEIIYPFINVSNEWISLFFDNFLNSYNYKNKYELTKDNNYILNNKNDSDKIAISFMEFLDDIVPQYKENILKSAIFIKKNSH